MCTLFCSEFLVSQVGPCASLHSVLGIASGCCLYKTSLMANSTLFAYLGNFMDHFVIEFCASFFSLASHPLPWYRVLSFMNSPRLKSKKEKKKFLICFLD